jgi:alpha-amylase
MKRQFIAAALVAVASIGLTVVSAAAATGPGLTHGSGSAATQDVTAHLFQWPWRDVARECLQVLGPAGYGAVQVSPPQEHVVLPDAGYPWWQTYQPVSYRLTTRYGSLGDFALMVQACHLAGVRVYVDAVVNHMTGQADGGVGSAGTRYGYFDYPGLYGYDDFHHCGRNGDDTIHNWDDRWEVQHCALLGLADLATETEHVRTTVAGYLNRLLLLGVDGFRIDAAKHIPAEDLAAIKAKLRRPAYFYQEVLGNTPIAKAEYTGIGDVTEDGYGQQLGRVFATGKLDWLSQFGEVWGLAPSATSIVYVGSHDSERDSNGTILSYQDGPLMELATVFSLAWPYGHPLLLSSYGFTDRDAGPPSARVSCDRTDSGPGGWLCQDRATVAAAITLHVTAEPGQSVFVVGSVPALGTWDPAAAVALTQVDPMTWTGAVDLPGSQLVEYKYIRRNAEGTVVWESDPNRTVTTASGGSMTLDDTWR